MTRLSPLHRLAPVLKHQAWGSVEAIPALLGRPADGRPVAELWLGGLPGSASPADGDEPLDRLLAAAGAEPLRVLVKLLAVASPVSLQVHPDDAGAARGHAADPAHFPDPAGKPELLRALGPFTTLSGLRAPDDAQRLLARLGLDERLPTVTGALSATDATKALAAALDAGADVVALVADRVGATGEPGLEPLRRVVAAHPNDPAVVAALLLRPYQLEPGDALWCPAGCPHVHVSGLAVEVQASADTTLRAGLTDRPVDHQLFLDHLGDRPPARIGPRRAGAEQVVAAPDGDLRLGVVDATTGAPVSLASRPDASLLLCLDGPASVSVPGAEVRLEAGSGAYVAPATGPLRVTGGMLARASRLAG